MKKMMEREIKRSPVSGTFELTGRCNLNCKMCYVHVDDQRIRQLGRREKTAEEWICMGKQVFDAGTFQLLLTGGEPMLRPDFCETYQAIASMGFYLTLYTNATLVTPRIMEVLRKYPPHTLGVTIYGLSPETYGNVCGHPEAYERMMAGLEKLLTLPSRIELRTTVVRDNLEEADEIETFIKSFGKRVTFNINQLVFQSGRNSIGNPGESRLAPEQCAAFYCRRYQRMTEEYAEDREKLTELRADQEERLRKEAKAQRNGKKGENSEKSSPEPCGPFGCGAGYREYTISWDGRLLPCSLFEGCSANPFEEGFQQAWERLGTVMPEPKLPEQCRMCGVQKFCGACPASRYCETGDLNGVPQYFCRMAEAYQKILSK